MSRNLSTERYIRAATRGLRGQVRLDVQLELRHHLHERVQQLKGVCKLTDERKVGRDQVAAASRLEVNLGFVLCAAALAELRLPAAPPQSDERPFPIGRYQNGWQASLADPARVPPPFDRLSE